MQLLWILPCTEPVTTATYNLFGMCCCYPMMQYVSVNQDACCTQKFEMNPIAARENIFPTVWSVQQLLGLELEYWAHQ